MELLIFGGIPVLTVAAIFLVKRKLLWAAPVISAALALTAYTVALGPVSMAEVFRNSEWRGFLLLAMLSQFGITAMLSAIAGFAAYIIRRNKPAPVSQTDGICSVRGGVKIFLSSVKVHRQKKNRRSTLRRFLL